MPKRILEGVVVRDDYDKTIKVLVSRLVQHKVYKKVIRVSKKYMVHDDQNKFKKGDFVKIQEHRPISATKKWVVLYN